MPYRRSIVAVVVAVLALVMVSPALAGTGKPTVIPPPASSAQTGKTYGELAAAWQQTILPIATSLNPQNDSSGANCQRGNTSQIFFLAGSLTSTPVTRNCTVPATKPIFFPIINGECSNLEQPPFFGATDAERATCAQTLIDGVSIGSLKVTLDGRAVPNLGRFRAASPPFDFTVPADNILGVPGPASGRSSSDGFWVLLRPLHRGNHVIHFEAAVVSGPAAGFTQDVTYLLTVQ
jgi:hypothetical protein